MSLGLTVLICSCHREVVFGFSPRSVAYLVSDSWPPKQCQVVRTQPQIKPQIQRVNCIRVLSWRNQIRRNTSTEVKTAQFMEVESNFIFMQEGREKQYAIF